MPTINGSVTPQAAGSWVASFDKRALGGPPANVRMREGSKQSNGSEILRQGIQCIHP